ncbi:hypothetical protein [Mariprofundus ferrooxydans]|nr:hypothetical protein [Mariprofundus ferrooxydans]
MVMGDPVSVSESDDMDGALSGVQQQAMDDAQQTVDSFFDQD